MSRIAHNIAEFGRHIYRVLGGKVPRFCYTIGHTEREVPELILAGAAWMPGDLVSQRLNQIGEQLQTGAPASSLGGFRLGVVDPSWISRLMLGAVQRYGEARVSALQLIPEGEDHTIDVPDMRQPFAPEEHPVWKWLDAPWPYALPPETPVVTNLDALQGYAISELARWEELEWEMFSGSGPELPRDQLLLVPLATLLAFDPSLEAALEIAVGSGLYRTFDDNGVAGAWQPWTKSTKAR